MVAAGERIHVIGIAGAGAAGTALLAAHAGARVDGCDAAGPSEYTAPLPDAGVSVLTGHDREPPRGGGPRGGQRRTASAAGPARAGRRSRARHRGGRLAGPAGRADGGAGSAGVAVAGTHGKSTATALLGHLLVAAGHDPTVEVGAHDPGLGRLGALRWGTGVRRRGRRVRRQLPPPPPVRGPADDHRDGSPRRLRRHRRGVRHVRPLPGRDEQPRAGRRQAPGGPGRG